jgi:hypothetical protein
VTVRLKKLAPKWRSSTVGSESTLHQLAPYIGKLKTSVASTLIEAYSRKDDVIIDPFCGSGVVPLEALLNERSVIANDLNPYAAALTKAKLFPIRDVWKALAAATTYVERAKVLSARRQHRVSAPQWVREFFHPRTLAEVKTLADLLRRNDEWFLLGNLLGILHHQRPGFLSYPSSHLVPYLRLRKFPKRQYPELYRYRDPEPRLIRKLLRTYSRLDVTRLRGRRRAFVYGDICHLSARRKATVAITSPPYMNALDYGRDNRLRLWFLGVRSHHKLDVALPTNEADFTTLMATTARKLERCLAPRGKAVLVVGEVRRGTKRTKTNEIVRAAFEQDDAWKLVDEIDDAVPDIRRSRRTCRGTKTEWIMVFKKTA